MEIVLLACDLIVGAAAVAIVLAAPWSPRRPATRIPVAGAVALVTVPLPAAVAFHPGSGSVVADQVVFVLALAAFVAGSLTLIWRDDEGPPPVGEPSDPPWWPEFERAFRRYARRPRVPV
jgi:hypothetical protein